MKQLLQDAHTGAVRVEDVPPPQLLRGCVLVRVEASLISAGTERASSEFASKNLFAKAKARPDLVRDVLAKLRRDGLFATLQTVRSRLDQPQSLGYSSAGTVAAVGDGITDIDVGDRVACAGTGYAVHAEFACVPRLLMASIPPGSKVSSEEAAFGTVGAICLHGIRTARVSIGDTVAVIGLGLLGQVTVQLLKAAGCRVFGMDLLPDRANLAIQSGAEAASNTEAFRDLCLQRTGGTGVDSVIITAETASSGPVQLAAQLARDRAIVAAVGTVGMDISRKLFFEKELDFRVSRSYGPGRYDAAYEQKGRDYPIGYVRWTETRNMEAFLQFIVEGKLNLSSLITHRFPIEQATRAYDLISGRTGERFLGVVIDYPEAAFPTGTEFTHKIPLTSFAPRAGSVGIGMLGAGNFAQNTLLPALKSLPEALLVGVCNATGSRSRHAAEKFGFSYCTDSESEILNDSDASAIVIATRHHLHADQVIKALNAGKHVFCEKPLCLAEHELSAIVRAQSVQIPGLVVMVGFNRRFASMGVELKKFLADIHEPFAIHYRVNAGFIPADHWVNDPEQGGGRILGEVCHFVDFLCYLTDSCPIEVRGQVLGNPGQYSMDNVVATLRFANGTVGTISYLANGDKAASKERIEIFGGGSVAILEDFRRLELVRGGRKQLVRSRWRQDKGHQAEMRGFVDATRGKIAPPIPFDQIVGSTLATIRLQKACQIGEAVPVDGDACMTAALENQQEKGTAGEC